MKKLLFIQRSFSVVGLLLFITTVTVKAQITFQKTFGGVYGEGGNSVQQTTDGGYIIVGVTESFGVFINNVYLIKTNSSGDTLWTKTFGGTGNDWGYSVQQTTDGGYILSGITSSFSGGGQDIYLIRTDANGDSTWTRTFGKMGNDDAGEDVQQTIDGGFIIIGFTQSSAGFSDVYLVKTDMYGNLVWTKTFGGTGSDVGYYIQQTPDSGYIITGNTASFGSGSWDVYLIKTNVNGDSLWTKTYGGVDADNGNFVQQTTDGGYIITGNTTSFGAGNYDVYLIKTNSTGDTLWTRTFGGSNYDDSYSVKQTNDGGYIVAGYTLSFGSGPSDAYLIKTNSIGDTLWTKTFGGAGVDQSYSVQQTTDSGFIVVGALSFGGGNSDVYLIKTDSNGNSGCNESSTATIVGSPATQVTSPATIVTSPNTIVTNPATIVGSGGIDSTLCTSVGINEIVEEEGFEIFPNPAKGKFTVSSPQSAANAIEIYNLVGEKIYTATYCSPNRISPSADGLTTVDCRLFSPGIYFVKVQSEKGSAVRKLVVE